MGIMILEAVIIVLMALVAVLGIIGFVMEKRGHGRKFRNDSAGNVADLNDRFNRARYMDQDGK